MKEAHGKNQLAAWLALIIDNSPCYTITGSLVSIIIGTKR
jgi:hypothetical protein